MEPKIFYDQDADLNLIKNAKVAIIGYGNQGKAHAHNLRDSGVDLRVGLREDSSAIGPAREAGLGVMTTSEAAAWANVIMVLVPDEKAAPVYQKDIEPYLQSGDILAFSHGFNICFDKIKPSPEVTVILVAPKGAGYAVRAAYAKGSGVPCLVAVHQDPYQKGLALALSYAKALGGTRAGVFATTFKEETETDLFSEQAILCGGLPALIKAGFETLVEAGYAPAVAYFECLHEVKLIADLLYQKGLEGMNQAISNTAEWGGYLAGDKIIGESSRKAMKAILADIQSGRFADGLLEEINQNNGRTFEALRCKESGHPIEPIGAFLRAKMTF